MRILRFAPGLALVALVVPTMALAQRDATIDESTAIAAAAGLAAECTSASVSTVDETWAAATGTNAEGCATANGVMVLRLDTAAGTWSTLAQGSDDPTQSCPFDSSIPLAVQTDLRLCRPRLGKGWIYADVLLRRVPGRVESSSGSYSRTKFKHWTKVGRTGCTARQFVLWQETLRRPKPRCTSRIGRWRSAYDNRLIGRASLLDIDHMVPLAEAWRSGAATQWDAATRQRFANDVSYPHSLIAVSASTNRSKGDKDPARWMPPRESFECAYAVRWIAVKFRWRLAADPAERRALNATLSDCPSVRTKLRVPPRGKVTNAKPKPSGDSGGSSGGGYPQQPDQPGDQDCSDFDTPVMVLPGDPDGLDADGDGIGCESNG